MSRRNGRGRGGRGRRRGGARPAGQAGAAPPPAANFVIPPEHNLYSDEYDSDSDEDELNFFRQLAVFGALKRMQDRSGGGAARHHEAAGGRGAARETSAAEKQKIVYTEDQIAVNTIYASFKTSQADAVTEESVRKLFAQFGPIKQVRLHTAGNNNTYEGGEQDEHRGVATRGRPRRYQERVNRYGFVSFEKCEDAAICLQQKFKLHKQCYVAKADSWHQEAYKKKQAEEETGTAAPPCEPCCSTSTTAPTTTNTTSTTATSEAAGAQRADHNTSNASEEPEGFSILQLNDDCLMTIFSEVELLDLLALKKTCTRFEGVCCDLLKRQKKLDLDNVCPKKTYLTMLDAKNILIELGPFAEHLIITRDTFARPGVRILYLIPKHCSNLKQLDIHDFTLKPNSLKTLEGVFKTLESLRLVNCGIADNIERSLAQAKNLRRLDLSQNSEITGKCLKVVKNLKYLNLESCQNIQGKPFITFSERNKTLEFLNINCCSRLTNEAVKALAANFPDLQHLICNNLYDNVEPASMAMIAKLPKLTKVQFKINNFASIDNILQAFTESNQLEHLDLSDGIFTSVDYNLLCSLTNLRELKLNYKLDFSDEHLAKLCTKGNFLELHIAGCTNVSDRQLIEFIRKNPALKELDVSYCQITEFLVFSAIDILKEQAAAVSGGGVARQNRTLRMIVGQTSICPVINDNALVKSNRHLLELSFYATEGFYSEMDEYDDVMGDHSGDDEDFMGYDYEDDDSDLWGLDYDSDLGNFVDMCQFYYDSDSDNDYKYMGYGDFM
uniref:Putative leucine-rich repeat protein n=1 Tax=Culex tarsalis TaxID=7177 RepID=A0A1Q3F0E4_CULTA